MGIHYAGTVPSLTARFATGLAAWSAAWFLSSCGSSPSEGHAHPARSDDTPVISGEPAVYNNTDVAFANTMGAHEEQGITMSRLAPDHSNDPELITFAAKVAATLQVDTQVLKALAAQWKDQDNRAALRGPDMTTTGAIDNATITRLDSLHGAEFDTSWLKSMISLDHGSLEIANTEIAHGKNPDAIGLANQIVTARQAEIGQIQDLLAS